MNILLVDDQPNVLSSLLLGTNWRAMGFTSVFSATSAADAKTVMINHHVDILVTDIEMPGEDGISLLYWVREQKMEIECIILSSHADFFYAQQAISMKVTDFVVQPARPEDIARAVEHAVSNIREKQSWHSVKQDMLSAAVQNTVIKDFMEAWPFHREFALDQKIFDAKLGELRRFGFECEYDTDVIVLYMYITKWKDLPAAPAEVLNTYRELIRQHMGKLSEQCISYSVQNHIYCTVFFSAEGMAEDFAERASALRNGVRDVLRCLTQMAFAAGNVMQITDVRMMLQEKAPVLLEKQKNAGLPVQLVLSDVEAEKEIRENSEVYFLKIRDYIRKHISEPVSRVQIAEALYLSPGYVSFIIKKMASCSCRELITKEKMEYAKYLLNHTRKSVGDVALDCGFNSFAYFSKIYKEYYQIKPSDERRNLS